ncbi:helix-turn-helix transcriptional regulator [Saccharothrix sp.]|uniref:helix-turn-helix domain-containing protein n=1 Tax=Saccharothrix sp. TaxID=1873460 RepID=UPI002810ACDD|nr:helix-turn-helix transcriptional regulator [Saccharothrix sp.]
MDLDLTEANAFGARLREIREWRQMSQETLAGLAGYKSQASISRLESGQAEVPNRNKLELLADALRCAVEDLIDRPWKREPDPKAHAGLVAVEHALDTYEFGTDTGVPVRDWAEVQADVNRLVLLQHQFADYIGQGELAPKLMAELHAAYVRRPELRREVLLGLIVAYSSAAWVAKRLGNGRGWSVMATKEAKRCADELGLPQWRGYTAWLRADATGSTDREVQYRRAVSAADELRPALDHPETLQAYGMLNLSAALAAATKAKPDRDTATTHLAEAADVARRLDQEVGEFAHMLFGTVNVGIWTTSINLELGERGKVAEIARTVNIDAIESPSRRAEFYADVGRALLLEKGKRDKGLELLLKAEDLAPQRVRHDPLVREAVRGHVRWVKRDAVGIRLRGLASRMGLRLTTIG